MSVNEVNNQGIIVQISSQNPSSSSNASECALCDALLKINRFGVLCGTLRSLLRVESLRIAFFNLSGLNVVSPAFDTSSPKGAAGVGTKLVMKSGNALYKA